MTMSNRVYVFGVLDDGTLDFMQTYLDVPAARSACEKYLKMFPHRFDKMVYGTAVSMGEQDMNEFTKEDCRGN